MPESEFSFWALLLNACKSGKVDNVVCLQNSLEFMLPLFRSTPRPVTAASKGLGWDFLHGISYTKWFIILVVTGTLGCKIWVHNKLAFPSFLNVYIDIFRYIYIYIARWFNSWPFYPRSYEVTNTPLKDHLTIPKRWRIESPGVLYMFVYTIFTYTYTLGKAISFWLLGIPQMQVIVRGSPQDVPNNSGFLNYSTYYLHRIYINICICM